MVFVSISDDLNHIYLFHFLPGRDGDGDSGEQITRRKRSRKKWNRKNVEEIEMKSNESHSTLMHFSCSTLSSFTLPVIRYTEEEEGKLKITLNSWYTLEWRQKKEMCGHTLYMSNVWYRWSRLRLIMPRTCSDINACMQRKRMAPRPPSFDFNGTKSLQ